MTVEYIRRTTEPGRLLEEVVDPPTTPPPDLVLPNFLPSAGAVVDVAAYGGNVFASNQWGLTELALGESLGVIDVPFAGGAIAVSNEWGASATATHLRVFSRSSGLPVLAESIRHGLEAGWEAPFPLCAMSGDNIYVALRGADEVARFDLLTGRLTKFTLERVRGLAGGVWLYAVSRSGEVSVLSKLHMDGTVESQANIGRRWYHHVAVSAGNVVVGGLASSLSVFDPIYLEVLPKLPGVGYVHGVAVDSAGQVAAIDRDGDDQYLATWDLQQVWRTRLPHDKCNGIVLSMGEVYIGGAHAGLLRYAYDDHQQLPTPTELQPR